MLKMSFQKSNQLKKTQAGSKSINRRSTFVLLLCILFILSTGLSGCSASRNSEAILTAPLATLSEVSTQLQAPTMNSRSAIESDSYSVTIDVNPSIELTILNGFVTEAKAFNDDGQSILFENDVVELATNDAVKAIIQSLVVAGYISEGEIEPYLIVTVSNGEQADEELAEELEQCAEETLDSLDVECEVKGAYIPDDVVESASVKSMSIARYMIFSAIAENENMSTEETVNAYGDLKISELMYTFDYLKSVFKTHKADVDTEDENEDEDEVKNEDTAEVELDAESDGMTLEQLAIFKSSLEIYKSAKNAAKITFHQDMEDMITEYRASLDETREERHADKAAFKTNLQLLKEGLLAERRAAINDRNQAFKTAKAAFLTILAANGISEEAQNELEDESNDQDTDQLEQINDLIHDIDDEEDIEDDRDEDIGENEQDDDDDNEDDHEEDDD